MTTAEASENTPTPHFIDLRATSPGRPPEARRRSLAEEHSADTRRTLIEAATALFAAKGYEATSTPEILEAARVSRGAMYHHFESKAGLFSAVLEAVETDFINRLSAAGAPGDDVWQQITNGCQAFLDISLEAPVRRIVLIDGPAVLGWRRWKSIEARYGLGLLRDFLTQAMDDHLIDRRPVEPLADLLTGALNEAALAIAHANDQDTARQDLGDALRWLFDSLRVAHHATT